MHLVVSSRTSSDPTILHPPSSDLRIRILYTIHFFGSSDPTVLHLLHLRIFGFDFDTSSTTLDFGFDYSTTSPSSDIQISATYIHSFIGSSDPNFIHPHSLRIFGLFFGLLFGLLFGYSSDLLRSLKLKILRIHRIIFGYFYSASSDIHLCGTVVSSYSTFRIYPTVIHPNFFRVLFYPLIRIPDPLKRISDSSFIFGCDTSNRNCSLIYEY